MKKNNQKVQWAFNSTNGESQWSDSNNTIKVTPSDNKISYNVFSLAKAFLLLSEMTHKKLQKLCYYAKAWYLALNDENIIEDDFQAWVHGAVQPDLYSAYKEYGFDTIPRIKDSYGVPEEFIGFASDIFDAYGHLTGDELERLNHQEDPWKNARKGLEPWEKCNNVISEDDMKTYYRRLMKNE